MRAKAHPNVGPLSNKTLQVRILHVEDSENDRELVRLELARSGKRYFIKCVDTKEELIQSLQSEEWDLILSDFSMPVCDGMWALSIAKSTCPNTPFIFVSGSMGEEVAIESLKTGATDYVLKHRLQRLSSSVERALQERRVNLQRQTIKSELERSREDFRFLAYHDALTGLPNRTFLLEQLTKKIKGSYRQSDKLAVLFIDLDHFKLINDSFGHAAGDQLLQQVSERLRNCVRAEDTVARLGGDEFVVVLWSLSNSKDPGIIAANISKSIANGFFVHGMALHLTCSIGISVFPQGGHDGPTLLKNADVALFCAKRQGRNKYRFFSGDMNGRSLERLVLESGLPQALEKQQLFLEYQPQIDISTGRIVGAEALIRWCHPELGMVSPRDFIPIAEDTGDIIAIGEWVLKTACAEAKRWDVKDSEPIAVAVNVSAMQFEVDSFSSVVQKVLEET